MTVLQVGRHAADTRGMSNYLDSLDGDLTLRRLTMAPRGVSTKRLVRGSYRLLVLQVIGGAGSVGFLWFSEMMRIMGGH